MTKMPPVPPEQRSPKGPGSDPKVQAEDEIPGRENFDQRVATETSSRIRATKATSRIANA